MQINFTSNLPSLKYGFFIFQVNMINRISKTSRQNFSQLHWSEFIDGARLATFNICHNFRRVTQQPFSRCRSFEPILN